MAVKYPSIPRVNSPELQPFVRAVTELLEVGLLQLPNSKLVDKFVRYQDLVDLGLAEEPEKNNPLRVTPTVVYDPTTDTSTPPIISGLAVISNQFANVLTWIQPSYNFFSFVEIWRAETLNILDAQKIGTAVSPQFNDDTRGNATLYYWVRAISQSSVAGPFNDTVGTLATVPPVTPPTLFSSASGTAYLLLAQDGTIISRVFLSWINSVDTDVVEHQVAYKKSADPDWITWESIKYLPVNVSYVGPLDDGVQYDFRIRSVRKNGEASTWVTITNYTIIGKTAVPQDVTAFTAQQNRNVVLFQWTQVSDVDLAGYEIRYANVGGIWGDGTPLTEVTRGTQVTSAAVPPGTWSFMIKAVDTSGNYSANAISYTLTVEAELDVIISVQQAPDWSGTKVNFVEHWTGVLIPKDQNIVSVSYNNFEWCDQFVPTPEVICTYEAPEIDIDFDDNARVWGSIESALGPGVVTGEAKPTLSLDYRRDADAYDGFEPWAIGTVTARYFKHKLTLDTSIGKAKITGFLPTVDQAEKVLKGSGVTIAALGTAILFNKQFHVKPTVTAQAISTTGLFAAVSAITTSGFTAQIFNTSGADVGGVIDWTAVGV